VSFGVSTVVDDDVEVDVEFDVVVVEFDSDDPDSPFSRSLRPQKDKAKPMRPIESRDRIDDSLRCDELKN
jgi:hypothetical protein